MRFEGKKKPEFAGGEQTNRRFWNLGFTLVPQSELGILNGWPTSLDNYLNPFRG
jgi:hypothetical protein